jgi:hypothetical protein
VAINRKKRVAQLPLPWERTRRPLASGVSLRRLGPTVGLVLGAGSVIGAYALGTRHESVASTRALLAEVRSATRAFVSDVGRCPRDTRELMHPPRTGREYLGEPPVDAWGQPVYLRCIDDAGHLHIEVLSAGPSGSFVDEDNIM